jgi:hypothetical protein
VSLPGIWLARFNIYWIWLGEVLVWLLVVCWVLGVLMGVWVVCGSLAGTWLALFKIYWILEEEPVWVLEFGWVMVVCVVVVVVVGCGVVLMLGVVWVIWGISLVGSWLARFKIACTWSETEEVLVCWVLVGLCGEDVLVVDIGLFDIDCDDPWLAGTVLPLLRIESTKFKVLVTCCCSVVEVLAVFIGMELDWKLVSPLVILLEGVIPLARSKIAWTSLLLLVLSCWLIPLELMEGVLTKDGILNVGCWNENIEFVSA